MRIKIIKVGLIVLMLFSVTYTLFILNTKNPEDSFTSYTRFINLVNDDQVVSVRLFGDTLRVLDKNGEQFSVLYPTNDQQLINDILKHNVDLVVMPQQKRNILLEIIINSIPVLLLIGVWLYYINKQNGGRLGTIGASKAKLLNVEEHNNISFSDVAGCDEAKEELMEIIDFLKNPEKFQKLGGKVPRGVLLTGEPGTGKTLLSKAVAHEADVPFYFCSGSDFVEMFVGVGSSRVRDMFSELKKNDSAILFIDEIDAVGKARGMGFTANDERDQTLNALLVEMDGFETHSKIIIIAATNRPDVLDKALLRPGRFDRQVSVGLPDMNGRKQILNVHIKNIPIDMDVDLMNIARGTSGFSGADLSNLVNEAAIFASREGCSVVSNRHFEKAKDKILMGVERRTFTMSDDEKKITAYHEAGHAVVGYFSPQHDPIYKVSIVPRGSALGITMFLPERDSVSMSKTKLESQICSLYGGRIAEEMFAGDRKSTRLNASHTDISRMPSSA